MTIVLLVQCICMNTKCLLKEYEIIFEVLCEKMLLSIHIFVLLNVKFSMVPNGNNKSKTRMIINVF